MPDARFHHTGHGPTRREQQVLDLQEQGLGATEIARRPELKPSYVSSILGRLGGPGSDRAWETMVRMGSASLLAAIRRHHPERCA